MAINVNLIFPKALVGITSPLTPEETAATADLSFPLPTLEASCNQGYVFPAPTLEAEGFGGGVVNADLDATLPTLSATGLTGSAGTANLEVPAPTLEAYGPNSADLEFSAPTLSATVLTGSAGSLDVTLKKIALAAEGYAGTVSTVSLTLPLVELDAAGHAPAVGTAELTIPLLTLTATAHGPELDVQTVLVMNADTNGLTTYSNFAFNSFAEFNGVFLGASSSGIYALGGDLDQAAVIAATAKLGLTDFGSEQLKRVEAGAYVGYRTDGSLTLTVTADEGTSYSYTLTRRQTDKLHASRVKLGKGIKGRYLQAQIANVAGADFELDDLQLKPNEIRRKI